MAQTQERAHSTGSNISWGLEELPLLRMASWRALKAKRRSYSRIWQEMGIGNRLVMTLTG